MSDERRRYLGEQLTHAVLHRRQAELRARHEGALQKVDRLLDTQRALGRDLGEGMRSLGASRDTLKQLESAEGEGGLLSVIVRPFTARRTALARRSVTEALLAQHQKVSVRLREATAFSDELQLTALELQQEVDRLHRELGEALHNQREAARRVLEAEAALQAVDSDPSLDEAQRDRRRDRFTFDLRTETVSLDLFDAAAQHCRTHLPAARALRDTVLKLHEDMAAYVLDATHTVNAAGRRILGLGVLADAPLVVAELQESLEELSEAMAAAQAFVEGSQQLIAEVLPDLSAQIQARSEAEAAVLRADLEAVDRARSREMAERALRDAAESEIDDLLGRRR